MSNTEHTHGLFAELLQGAKALEERPQLEARIRDLESDRDYALQESFAAKDEAQRLREHLSSLEARIAEREAALAQATKSAEDAQNTLTQIVGLVKGISDDVGAVVSLAEPPVPPMPYASTSDTTGGYSLDPIGEGVVVTSVEADRGPSEEFPASDGASPTGSVFERDPFANSIYHHEETTPNPTPTAGGDAEWSTPNATEVTPNTVGNKPYWTKPDHQTWQSWLAEGGDLAPWVRHHKDMDNRN